MGLRGGKYVKHCETTCTGNISNMKSIYLSWLYKSNQTSPFSCEAGKFQVRQNMAKTQGFQQVYVHMFIAYIYIYLYVCMIHNVFQETHTDSIFQHIVLFYASFLFFLRSIALQIVKPPRPRSPSALNRGLSCPPQQWPQRKGHPDTRARNHLDQYR